jgi:hypothetical protein
MIEAASGDLGQNIEAVARACWGDPERSLSSAHELRFGTHGARSVDLAKGVWHDHEAGEGGGVLDLLAREKGLKGKAAFEYLREQCGLAVDLAPSARRIVATYDYCDESGTLAYQVVRYQPKDFCQRRPDPAAADGWSWSVKGAKPLPYRLADLFSLEGRGTVYVVEGEKDADALNALGLTATCNAGGAGKWPEALNPYFDGLDVVILPDNDDAGRRHAEVVAASVRDYASSVRTLDLPGLPAKGDVSDWLRSGGTAERLQALVGEIEHWKPAPPVSRFGAVTWDQIDTVAIRQDWLIEDIIFEGDSGLIFGASGSGKSFLAVDMGLSIARGIPFMGKATRKGAVLYQAGEGGKGLVKRLRAYRQARTVVGEVPFVLLPARVDLFSGDGDAEAFIDECLAWKAVHPDLAALFIDTLSTASPGANENASEDMSRLLAFGEAVQRRVGISVIWVHHKNAAGDRERGHTSLRANVDTALEVNRDDDDNRTLKVVKLKDGEDGEKIGFELQSVTIGTYDSGKPMTSCVVRPAEVGSSRTGMSRLSNGQHLFLTCLDTAVAQKGGIVPSSAGAPDGAYGVEWEHFKTIYTAVRGGGIEASSLRSAMTREGEALMAKGYVGRSTPWVWITASGSEYLTRYGK